MNEKCVDRLIDRYCKIVTKDPGDKRTHVVNGLVKGIGHDDGFITIESWQGLGVLNIKTIVAIKPKLKK